jgi:hypothetical protein
MGDRANLAIISEYDDCVVLYAHWAGEQLFDQARIAMDHVFARSRWTDAPYLRRIVFQQILDWAGLSELSWGISTNLCDNEHPILVIDVTSQRVAFRNEQHFNERVDSDEGVTFSEFADGTAMPSWSGIWP